MMLEPYFVINNSIQYTLFMQTAVRIIPDFGTRCQILFVVRYLNFVRYAICMSLPVRSSRRTRGIYVTITDPGWGVVCGGCRLVEKLLVLNATRQRTPDE